jgi:WD40 repeat protein
LAAAAANGSLFLWHLKDGPEPHILPEPDGNLASHVSFSPDGRLLAGGYSNGMFKVWSTATGELLTTVNCDIGWVINVAFSPDGKLLATGSQTVVLWGVPSER